MFRRRWSVAALSLVLLPCWAETSLEFDWPDGLTASFSYTKSKTQFKDGQQTQHQAATVAYRMAVRKEPQGVVVRYAVGDTPELAALSAVDRERVQTALRIAMPPIRVTEAGYFEDIHDIEAFRQSLLAFYAASFPASVGQRVLESFTSKEVLRATAEVQWNALVGTWLGSTFEPGESYSIDLEGELPLAPGQKFVMTTTYRLVREVDCRRAGRKRRCVELESVARPKDESLSQAIETFAKRASGDPDVLSHEPLGAPVVEIKTRLVTEPDTLVPHEVTVERRISDDKASGLLMREETVYRFSYE
jgi:hypothetical protein